MVANPPPVFPFAFGAGAPPVPVPAPHVPAPAPAEPAPAQPAPAPAQPTPAPVPPGPVSPPDGPDFASTVTNTRSVPTPSEASPSPAPAASTSTATHPAHAALGEAAPITRTHAVFSLSPRASQSVPGSSSEVRPQTVVPEEKASASHDEHKHAVEARKISSAEERRSLLRSLEKQTAMVQKLIDSQRQSLELLQTQLLSLIDMQQQLMQD